eukprot:TRINITY_DN6636_c0_g1_i2.p1 TRINITY_DN6636_c0_g1~~TRINITY_DN6636_c0_g1_i2.p1  ORF type:complete len:144 (-),score=8.16 TRINITY_DN6636_c0_g1_i2:507-938(-)
MNAHKSSFLMFKGCFDLWIPSKRTEAAIVTLFYHILQHSPILRSVVLTKFTLATSSPSLSGNYLSSTSSWSWFQTAIHVINSLDLISNVMDNSLMWSMSLECEMITLVDKITGDLLCSKLSDSSLQFIISSSYSIIYTWEIQN